MPQVRPVVSLASYRCTGFSIPFRDHVTTLSREELAAMDDVEEVLSFTSIEEAIASDEFSAQVQVVLFESVAEAQACVYGYQMGIAHEDDMYAVRGVWDGGAVAVLVNAGDVDRAEVRYVDRRGDKDESWDSAGGEG